MQKKDVYLRKINKPFFFCLIFDLKQNYSFLKYSKIFQIWTFCHLLNETLKKKLQIYIF